MNVNQDILIYEIGKQVAAQSDYTFSQLLENYSLLQKESMEVQIDWNKAKSSTGYKDIQKWYRQTFEPKIFNMRKYKMSSFLGDVSTDSKQLQIEDHQKLMGGQIQSGSIFQSGSQIFTYGGFSQKYVNTTQILLQTKLVNLEVQHQQPLRAHSVVNYNGKPYIFGGDAQGTAQDNLYRFETDYILINSDIQPPARYGHGAAVLENKMYIFGGKAPGKLYNDFWKFDFVTNIWTKINIKTPEKRCFFAFFTYKNRIILIGGRCENLELGDVWAFDEKQNWQKLGEIKPQSNLVGCDVYGSILVATKGVLYQFNLQTLKLRHLSAIQNSCTPSVLFNENKLYIYTGTIDIFEFSELSEFENDVSSISEPLGSVVQRKSSNQLCSVEYVNFDNSITTDPIKSNKELLIFNEIHEVEEPVSSQNVNIKPIFQYENTFSTLKTPKHSTKQTCIYDYFLHFSQCTAEAISQIINDLQVQKARTDELSAVARMK
ncbi:Kelch motif-containing protein [Spironucleus salmonicida]|uniref:Kelch motif-containing protein n=1 Tax=Spironucleus salmonicida TaxID=348837 RepID=V6LNX1_9EUKA|nr:Kelch motif-containing protein [Spironucleus salmonicida]|eukprot:EST45416.1 hypothetical protein SS50377_14648 [Spironucleus salmonicida]